MAERTSRDIRFSSTTVNGKRTIANEKRSPYQAQICRRNCVGAGSSDVRDCVHRNPPKQEGNVGGAHPRGDDPD